MKVLSEIEGTFNLWKWPKLYLLTQIGIVYAMTKINKRNRNASGRMVSKRNKIYLYIEK